MRYLVSCKAPVPSVDQTTELASPTSATDWGTGQVSVELATSHPCKFFDSMPLLEVLPLIILAGSLEAAYAIRTAPNLVCTRSSTSIIRYQLG